MPYACHVLLTNDSSLLSAPAVPSCAAEAHDAAGVTQLGGLEEEGEEKV